MNRKQIEEIRARCEAATSGKWISVIGEWYGEKLNIVAVYAEGCEREGHIAPHVTLFEDAIFIAHAREDIPALLAEVERLTKERDKNIQEINDLAGLSRGRRR